jgi:hypothetical protein
MVRLINITVSKSNADNILPVLNLLEGKLVMHLSKFFSHDFLHITFKVKDKHTQAVLEEVNKTGCGVAFGQIDVLPLVMSRPSVAVLGQPYNSKKLRKYRFNERMTVDEISGFIDTNSHLTFNYMALLTLASIISGIGSFFCCFFSFFV